MLVKAIKTEHYQDYKVPCMFIACHSCSFKCDKEYGEKICQNSPLANIKDFNVSIDYLIQNYISNPITKAVVFGGLEPFEDISNVLKFIKTLRTLNINDDIIIYTGYTKEEISKCFPKELLLLTNYNNIIIKYGRFIPNKTKHYDKILGVYLSSDNQYAEKLQKME